MSNSAGTRGNKKKTVASTALKVTKKATKELHCPKTERDGVMEFIFADSVCSILCLCLVCVLLCNV